MIFVGYKPGAKAYRLWNPATRSIVISANVHFSENKFPSHPNAPCPPIPTAANLPQALSSKNQLLPTEVELPNSFFDEESQSSSKKPRSMLPSLPLLPSLPSPLLPPLPPSSYAPSTRSSSCTSSNEMTLHHHHCQQTQLLQMTWTRSPLHPQLLTHYAGPVENKNKLKSIPADHQI